MTYELAKKLKDAGFPQIWGEGYFKDLQGRLTKKGYEEIKGHYVVYFPTLSELIEACGKRELYMISNPERGGSVRTRDIHDEDKIDIWFDGESLEIALANLYIALHEQTSKD